MNPRVSVVMPVFNGENFIRESLESLIRQSFRSIEIIVVDDASTDNSVAVIVSYEDSRVRLIRHKYNLGAAAARNTGVANANGEYLAFLDCDDVALPHRIEKQVACLDEDLQLGMLGSWVEIIDNESKPTGDVWRYPALSNTIVPLLLFQNTFAQSAVMMRKSVLSEPLYCDFPLAEDYDLWVRIASAHKVINIQEILTRYRSHAASLSCCRNDEMNKLVKVVYAKQLERLDINPTLKQLEFHFRLGRMQYEMLAHSKDEVNLWLMKIYSANLERYVYSPVELGHVLARHWFLACKCWSSWNIFWNSPLSKLMQISLNEKIALAFRSLLVKRS